jgi:hypothetical protein
MDSSGGWIICCVNKTSNDEHLFESLLIFFLI